jgi:heme A synthase
MRGHDLFRIAAVLALVLCYGTILLGGNVITTDNGLACPDWPTCYGNGNLLPAFSGGAAIEWSHRVAAFFLSVGVLTLTLLGVAFERTRKVLLRLSIAALALVVTEALLGGVVIETSLSAGVVLLHLAIATALFGLLLVLAMLANLREMPRRWIDWARRASEEDPAAVRAAAARFGDPRASPPTGSPAERPSAGAASWEG